MNIALGADAHGWPLKETIKLHLRHSGAIIEDVGVGHADQKTPYYQIAEQVANGIINGQFDRGILLCGTGMGMAIIANKHPGIYAAVCESPFAAAKSRSINNANVLTLGAMLTTAAVAEQIVDIWLNTEFTDGWNADIQTWLRDSMQDIGRFEQRQFKTEQ